MHRLVKKNGKYYADGREYNTFKEALSSIWNERQ